MIMLIIFVCERLNYLKIQSSHVPNWKLLINVTHHNYNELFIKLFIAI